MKQEQSKRIQTSVLNAAEKRVLVWLAQRQPRWVTSDMLTAIGVVGAIVVAAGYILSNHHIGWLWLASLGFVINSPHSPSSANISSELPACHHASIGTGADSEI